MPQAEPHIQRTSIPDILTKRSDFVAASKRGDKAVAFSVIVQKRDRGDTATARYGITASKKIGNAVARNRAKRRLREIVRHVLTGQAEAGNDYVLIARHNTGTVEWGQLVKDFNKALKKTQPQDKAKPVDKGAS